MLLRFKKRHLSLFFASLLLLVMWGLYGWNYWNGDREGYELYYHTRNTLSNWGGEFGYGYLNILASKSGLPYQAFQIAIAFLTLCLFFRYVVKRSISPFFFVLVYSICFFSLDFVLMRNFLAFAIVLQGMVFLFEGGVKGRLGYLLCVLLATTVHQSSLGFIIFAFMPLQRVVRLDRFFTAFILFVSAYAVIRSNIVLPNSVAQHFNYYGTTLKSSMANAAVHVSSLFLILMVVWSERKNIFFIDAQLERDKELIFIINLNFFSLIFLLLYFESEIFVRLMRCVLFFNIFYCVNALCVSRKSYVLIFSYLLVFSIYLVGFFLVPVARESVFPLFEYNLLLGAF